MWFIFLRISAVCSLDCGANGICESGKCRCNPGYVGALCDQLPCDTRCAEHGQCKNGTCVCSQGWNGRHCTLRKYIYIIRRMNFPDMHANGRPAGIFYLLFARQVFHLEIGLCLFCPLHLSLLSSVCHGGHSLTEYMEFVSATTLYKNYISDACLTHAPCIP